MKRLVTAGIVLCLMLIPNIALASHTWTVPDMKSNFGTQASYSLSGASSTPTGPLDELSSLVASDDNRGVYWTAEDLGNLDSNQDPHIYGLGKGGALVADIRLDVPDSEVVTGKTPDIEAMAVEYNAVGTPDRIFVGDIGDGSSNRGHANLYVFEEPTVAWNSSSTYTDTITDAGVSGLHTYARYGFQYYNDDGVTLVNQYGSRNAEAMFVDPPQSGGTGDVWVIAKENRDLDQDGNAAEARLFKINSGTLVPSVNTNKAIDQNSATSDAFVYNSMSLGNAAARITDASISPGRNYVVMRSYSEGFLWNRASGNIRVLFADHKNAPQGQVLDGSTGAFQTGYLTPSQLDERPDQSLEEAIAFRLPTGGAAWDAFVYVREYAAGTMQAADPKMFRVTCVVGATCPPQGS